MDMILSECLNAANEMARHGGFAPAQWNCHVFHAILPPWVTKTDVLMDQQLSVCSHVTERGHVERSYDGIVANEFDVLLCEGPHLWLHPTKLETLSRIAEKHEQVNMDCNGSLDLD